MKPVALAATLATLVTALAASTAAAQVDINMYNAQVNLEAAWEQLQASPYDYHGHRRKALDNVGKALEELHKAAFTYPPGKEQKDWQKYQKNIEKQQQREEKLERKELKREDELEERGH